MSKITLTRLSEIELDGIAEVLQSLRTAARAHFGSGWGENNND